MYSYGVVYVKSCCWHTKVLLLMPEYIFHKDTALVNVSFKQSFVFLNCFYSVMLHSVTTEDIVNCELKKYIQMKIKLVNYYSSTYFNRWGPEFESGCYRKYLFGFITCSLTLGYYFLIPCGITLPLHSEYS